MSSPLTDRASEPLDGRIPDGDPATAWARRKLDYKLVSPLNRRKFRVIVVGTGLAGAGCAGRCANQSGAGRLHRWCQFG